VRYLIFDFQSNPAIDRPAFKLSEARGEEILAENRGEKVGPRHILLYPPANYVADGTHKLVGGTMRSAWQIKPSDGFFVWQMRKQPVTTSA